MSTDVRQLLRSAAEVDVAEFGARAAMQRGVSLRWRRRVIVAVSVTLAVLAVVSFALSGPRIIGDASDITPAQRPRNVEREGRAIRERPHERQPVPDSGKVTAERRPGDEDGAATTGQGAPVHAAAACDPLIDEKADNLVDGSIDILRSSATYEPRQNDLVFTHTMRDIVLDETDPGEGPFYDLRFTFDDVSYTAVAYVTASGGQEFTVVRTSERPPVGTESAMSQAQRGNADGRIDEITDTVQLRMRLNDFNAREGTDLKVGSALTDIELIANPRGSSWSMQEHETDVASARCDYVIGR